MEQFQIVVGNRLRDISHAIQTHAVSHGYGAARDFLAHRIRPSIHEEPNFPHYGLPRRGLCLKEGITITIEPMITTGTWQVKMDSNGWTARTRDGSYCAHYEHSIAITKDGPVIMTLQTN